MFLTLSSEKTFSQIKLEISPNQNFQVKGIGNVFNVDTNLSSPIEIPIIYTDDSAKLLPYEIIYTLTNGDTGTSKGSLWIEEAQKETSSGGGGGDNIPKYSPDINIGVASIAEGKAGDVISITITLVNTEI